jgi:hypothetical protein
LGSGTVTATPPGPVHVKGTSVSLAATPGAGYRFLRWELDGTAAGAGSPLALTANADQIVTGVFERIPSNYTLGVTAGAGGAGVGSDAERSIIVIAGVGFSRTMTL